MSMVLCGFQMVLVGSLGSADAAFKPLSEKPKVLISYQNRGRTSVWVDADSHYQRCIIICIDISYPYPKPKMYC